MSYLASTDLWMIFQYFGSDIDIMGAAILTSMSKNLINFVFVIFASGAFSINNVGYWKLIDVISDIKCTRSKINENSGMQSVGCLILVRWCQNGNTHDIPEKYFQFFLKISSKQCAKLIIIIRY